MICGLFSFGRFVVSSVFGHVSEKGKEATAMNETNYCRVFELNEWVSTDATGEKELGKTSMFDLFFGRTRTSYNQATTLASVKSLSLHT